MRALAATLALALALLAAPPLVPKAAAQELVLPAETQEAGEKGPAIAVESSAASDAAIRNRIRDLYREIDGLEGVRVSVEAGVVRLTGTVVDADAQAEAEALASRVSDVAAVENAVTLDTDVQRRLAPVLKRTQDRLWNLVGTLPLLLVAALVFGVVVLIGLFLARRGWPFDRLAPNAFIAQLMRQAVRLVFVALGLVLALDILGATALIGTVLGAAGLVGL
ncbi:MAG: BON domain-containing protein, partial [Pseudomonadota bacterium]